MPLQHRLLQVRTKDGHLICRHDVLLDASTDVAERAAFADRRTTHVIQGVNTTGWFAADFSLAEIEQLYARQPMPFRDQQVNGKYRVPRFADVAAAAIAAVKAGTPVGLYIESKHPAYHKAVGLPLEQAMVQALVDTGVLAGGVNVILQSFDLEVKTFVLL